MNWMDFKILRYTYDVSNTAKIFVKFFVDNTALFFIINFT